MDIKISENEKLMAVALTNDQENLAKVELYDLDTESYTFKALYSIDSLPTPATFIDFSKNN